MTVTFSSMLLLYVAAGSALGGAARYLVGGFVQRSWPGAFPWGTLLINVTGSFLLGLIVRESSLPELSPQSRAFLGAGVCGGYTTFSAFSAETASLLDTGDWTRAALYVTASVAGSVLAAFAGMAAGR